MTDIQIVLCLLIIIFQERRKLPLNEFAAARVTDLVLRLSNGDVVVVVFVVVVWIPLSVEVIEEEDLPANISHFVWITK